MSSDFVDGAGEVRQGEALDTCRLDAWLRQHLPDLGDAPLEVLQFRKGHSNLTYLLRVGGRQLVLRRPPFGAKIATAHDMSREHRILTALDGGTKLAPRAVAYCDDVEVLGAPFYLMERARGVILRGNRAPKGLDLGPDVMRPLSTALVDTLAELHGVDVTAPGLADLGHPEGYVERQVRGWTERYVKAKTDDLPEVDRVAAWLAESLPEVEGAALVHNDFKYDNVVLDPEDLTRIVAVLDWEMATVGDPLMDLGTSLAYWVDPEDLPEVQMLPIGPTVLPGNLGRQQVVDRYAEVTGRDLTGALFYYAFGLFKVAVIAQQIYKRFKDGHTSDPRFGMLIMGVKILGDQAARAIDRERIHDLG